MLSLATSFRSGLREALEWPLLGWVSRHERVELIGGGDVPGVRPDGRLSDAAARKRLCAVMLPSDLVLVRDLVLPDLVESETLQALALEVERSSPFLAADTVWGSRARRIDDALIAVRLVLTSRQAVERHVQSVLGMDPAQVEIWAERDPPLIIRGFGEGPRLALERAHRHRIFALVGIVLVGFLGLAAAPFLQVRQIVFEAQAQYAALQQVSANALANRDALSRARTQGDAIASALHGQTNLLGLLESLSRAVPDTVHLTNLEVQGNLVKMTGQGPAASSIVDKLGASPQFAALRTTSAITRVGREGAAERFSVEFRYQPPELFTEPERLQ